MVPFGFLPKILRIDRDLRMVLCSLINVASVVGIPVVGRGEAGGRRGRQSNPTCCNLL